PTGSFTIASGATGTCALVANPALSAPVHTGAAPAVLPPGIYVVEAVTPPNYEIVKEEDKNILIGDNFIAPVTQQFGAITNIFIVPDQATVNNANPCYGTGGGCTNPTTNMGRSFNVGGFGPGGLIEMPAPCVGQLRIVPVYIKDYNGVEISRVYSDQWGIFNGLVYSTWQVNPPNPTGYAPGMMITCMNDPGPIPGPTPGSLITDPYYNPNYSNFCYENPFMPADTDYLDTPVVPTAAFAEGYNPPDCNYPDGTPAVLRVDGDGPGPWVSAIGHKITITS